MGSDGEWSCDTGVIKIGVNVEQTCGLSMYSVDAWIPPQSERYVYSDCTPNESQALWSYKSLKLTGYSMLSEVTGV